ncbi:uncharacterized protein Bfra_011148 [Botrytis fragariae]|uniref:Uncharacterized protein n=1 Tax=Botrytis fragariae TaxID=1964551 RepID=A0A8H6EEM0_9HELO|nr:uncharacterized protein Bfra_011148 [Botrytis fragariae]KAF5869341.1 hypothetical protein Bfra_011148 [Botrytis fragariae]
MPSFDNSSSETYDAVSQIPIPEMNHDQCDAEKLRIVNRIEHLQQVHAANINSGMDHRSDAIRELEQRIANLRFRFHEVDNQMRALDARDRAVVAQNTGYGSISRDRSSQSPPAPRAPNTSPQR